MSKGPLIVAALLALSTACGDQASAPTDKASSPSPSASSAPAINLPSPVPSGSPSQTATVRPLPTQGPALAKGAVQPADPGERLYDQSGVTKIRGCFTSERPPNTPVKLIVEKASGSRQQVVRDHRDAEGRGEVTTAVLEYRTDGTYLAFLRQKTQFPIESVTEFQPDPPVLLMPSEPKNGFAWTFKLVSTDGAISVLVDNKIDAANELVRVGTSDVTATRTSSTSRVTGKSSTGTLDLTIQATSWYSAERRLEVKSDTTTKGTAGLCEVDSQVISVLRL